METGRKAILPAIRKLLGSLQQMGRKLPTSSKKTIAEGLIMSKFQYLISQWGGGGNLQLYCTSTKTSKQSGQMDNQGLQKSKNKNPIRKLQVDVHK